LPNGGGFQIITTGGAGNIKAETAKTWGVGVVLTMPKRIADLSLAIDYWNINVKGEVGQLQNLILNFCYTAEDFPNNFYCDLIGDRYTPANAPTPTTAGNIISFQNPFLNIAQQLSAGIDFDARYATRLFGGQFSTQLQATRMTTQKIEFYPGAGLSNFNGTLGYPGFGSGPKWTGSLDTRFRTGNGITLRWGIEYIGKMSSQGIENVLFLNEQGAVCAEGSGGCYQVYYDYAVPSYFKHGASVQWLWRNIGQVTMGVSNIFDKDPPTISDDNVAGFPRFGNFFANGGYDYRGRSFFINVTRSF
jgi:iron complex outermembrane receptor protein